MNEKFAKIILENDKLKRVLEALANSELKDYYVVSGAVNQTVFNYLSGFPLDYGINDYDIAYFDSDTSYEAEDKVIKLITGLVNDSNIKLDIKNQARVPLWFEAKYGYKIKPYKDLKDAISRYGTTVSSIGIKLENGKLKVYAPYGLDDLFDMTIRPVKGGDYNKVKYERRSNIWKEKWPNLKVLPYEEVNQK